MGNKVLAILFCIDTGIGNAFLSPKIFNTFQQYFFKNSLVLEQLKRAVATEHRRREMQQQHLHVNQTRIRLRLLQPLLHQTISLPA